MAEQGGRLRNVRIREVLRAFGRFGFVVLRVRGSHYILKHPEKGLLVLPFRGGTVKVGILLNALEKAGISVEEFEREL